MSSNSKNSPVIVAEKVAKCFRVFNKPSDHLKEIFTLGYRKFHTPFWAVEDVSFEVRAGECLGIIGENGSGKSTLLRIIAGVIRATSGEVQVAGRVSALLELGAGFGPEFTGRENVFLNASILGFSDRETRERLPSIERFAEIGEFVDRPVKTYSTGMFVRLAFSVAIHMDPDILIVDEALSVGDYFFQQRCMRKILELKSRGVTILFVSHDLEAVRSLADEAIWMEHGKMKAHGRTDEVVSSYLAEMITRGNNDTMGDRPIGQPLEASAELDLPPEAIGRIPEFVQTLPNVDQRFGNRKAMIRGIGIYSSEGMQVASASQGDRVCIRISVECLEDVGQPNVGFMLRNRLGEDVTGTNTLFEGTPLEAAPGGTRLSVDFVMDLPFLQAGFYYFSPAVADGTLDRYDMCDWVDNACAVELVERTVTYGHMRIPVKAHPRFVDRGGIGVGSKE